MSRVGASIVVPPLLAVLTGCGDPGESADTAAQRADSAGVEIVLSSAEDRALDWTFERVLTLGGAEDGPESFYQLRHRGLAGTDDRGDLYVLDPTASRVVSFDGAGRHLRSVGGEGEGPGEFSAPVSLAVSGGGIVSVYDVRRGVLVRFGPDGALLGELSMTEFPPRRGDVEHVREADAGLVVARRTPAEDAQELVLVGPGGGMGGDDDPVATVLARLELPPPRMVSYERCRVGFAREPTFWPDALWDARARRIAFNLTADYRIDVIEDGRVARSVRRSVPTRPATRELAIRELGEGIHFRNNDCRITPEELLENHGMAENVQTLAEVRLSPDGEIWARRRRIAEPVPLGPAAPIFDVFDASGSYLGTTPSLPGPLFALLPDDRFVTAERDALDIERLVVWRIRKR